MRSLYPSWNLVEATTAGGLCNRQISFRDPEGGAGGLACLREHGLGLMSPAREAEPLADTYRAHFKLKRPRFRGWQQQENGEAPELLTAG